jgi:CheY-like chemotaxis protein
MFDIKETIATFENLKVLYVEDNQDARESTVDLLRNIFKDVIVAVDGQDGLEKFYHKKDFYDLIISDINMPKIGGIEMVRTIKQERDDISVFLLSAYNEAECPSEIEVDARLSKPLSFDEFCQELFNIKAKKDIL